jgi:hypothetical protein
MNAKQMRAGRAKMWNLDRNCIAMGGFKIGDEVLVMVKGTFDKSAVHIVEGFTSSAGHGNTPAAELKRPDGSYTLQWIEYIQHVNPAEHKMRVLPDSLKNALLGRKT